MRKSLSALFIKFIFTIGAVWISFSLFTHSSFSYLIALSVSGTVINYIIGDVFLLPRLGNLTSAITDGLLSISAALIIGIFFYQFTSTFLVYVVFGVMIAVAEYFFHLFLLSIGKVKSFRYNRYTDQFDYNEEVGNEFYVDTNDYSYYEDNDYPDFD